MSRSGSIPMSHSAAAAAVAVARTTRPRRRRPVSYQQDVLRPTTISGSFWRPSSCRRWQPYASCWSSPSPSPVLGRRWMSAGRWPTVASILMAAAADARVPLLWRRWTGTTPSVGVWHVPKYTGDRKARCGRQRRGVRDRWTRMCRFPMGDETAAMRQTPRRLGLGNGIIIVSCTAIADGYTTKLYYCTDEMFCVVVLRQR